MSTHHSTAEAVSVNSILGNLGMAIVKGLTGYFGNSYALIADAIESTSDVFASILVWLGIKYASRPADENHPYGHGRAETLITFIVVAFLVASAIVIAIESIHNMVTPHELPEKYTLVVLGIIILVKEFFFQYVMRKSVETGSSSLKADAWHHRSDAITSLMAFIGISIALLMGKGWEAADDWAALIASGFIIYNAYRIFRPALGEMLDEHFYDEQVVKIRQTAAEVQGVWGTEKCLIRKMGMSYWIDLHLIVDGNQTVYDGHAIAHKVKDKLMATYPKIADVFIHVEPHNSPTFQNSK